MLRIAMPIKSSINFCNLAPIEFQSLHEFMIIKVDDNSYKQMRFQILLFCFVLPVSLYAQVQGNSYLSKDEKGWLQFTEAGASHFANLALSCIQKEYPNKLNQVLKDERGIKNPKKLHPAFYGCFDWHSSVHGHWMLIRLLKSFPDLPEAKEIRRLLNENLSESNIKEEVVYFEAASKSWERMYGWSWLMKLSEELYDWNDRDGKQWKRNLQPLTDAIVQRYMDFLPKQTYPVRTGVHPNTAFGLSFALDFAKKAGRTDFAMLIESRARDYYLEDEDCPADWEPSGEDFLSACLEEANLMSRVLSKDDFTKWFRKFLPKQKLKALGRPAEVSDRSDPKLVHLDGVNLSRAWSIYGLLPYVKKRKLRKLLLEAAEEHLNATVPYIASEHYEGTHWLASFAVYALVAR